jgi:hypothetical protein
VLDEILGVATLVACVVAVVMARRASRRRDAQLKAQAFAQGRASVHAELGASVVVGDVTVIRDNSGPAIVRADHHEQLDHQYDDEYANLAERAALSDAWYRALRNPSDRPGVGELPDVQRDETGDGVPERGPLVRRGLGSGSPGGVRSAGASYVNPMCWGDE